MLGMKGLSVAVSVVVDDYGCGMVEDSVCVDVKEILPTIFATITLNMLESKV